MKRILLATTAIALASVTARAADMPMKAPPPAVAGCAQFGGFYVGVHGDWAVHDWNWRDRDGWVGAMNGGGQFGVSEQSYKSGGGGGVQAGWNWQTHCAVFGFEAD